MVSPLKVKKSVRRYLGYESLERGLLKRTLDHVSQNLEEAIIFGGMIREFGLGNTRFFKSDIDIVSLSSRLEIYAAIKDYSPKLNKFGGFRFSVGTQLFDIWSFNDTWAFRAGLVKAASINDIVKTTFFNLDAAAFSLQSKELLHSDDYAEALRARLLDLNLQENPSPASMARRAMRMVVENELSVSRRLAEYIVSNSKLRNVDYASSLFLTDLRKFIDSPSEEKFNFSPQKSLFLESENVSSQSDSILNESLPRS